MSPIRSTKRINQRSHPFPQSERPAHEAPRIPVHFAGDTPLSSSMRVRPRPLTLDGLECIRTLGSGSFGHVVVARVAERNDPGPFEEPGTLFAMKIYKKKGMRGHDKDHPDDKNWERRGLAKLPWNPFINGVIDAFVDRKNLYLALELLPCGTLHDAIYTRGPFDCTTSSFYFANIVCGLDFLHENGVVHRDLKPANILLGADGYLCLADFGYLKREEDTEGEWIAFGTPTYMAPELIAPQGYVGRSVDWFASGCILFEMLTKRMAFDAKSKVRSFKKITNGEYRWPKKIRVGKNAKDLTARLLTVQAVDRLGSMGTHEVFAHPWLGNIHWGKMQNRQYLAPFIPPTPDLANTWFDKPLPAQKDIPDMPVVRPPPHLRHDRRRERAQK